MFSYWQKQEKDPLFPDLLWSRPENKALLPKITIISGSRRGFADGEKIYSGATQLGSGALKILLPDVLKPQLPDLPDFVFTESSTMGSFGSNFSQHVDTLKSHTDLFIIAEDSRKESPTTQAIHKLIKDDSSDICLVGGAVAATDLYIDDLIKRKSNTVLVLDTRQLQKLVSRLPINQSLTSKSGLVDVVKVLHEISSEFNIVLIIKHSDTVLITQKGEVYSSVKDYSLNELASKVAACHIEPLGKNYINSLV